MYRCSVTMLAASLVILLTACLAMEAAAGDVVINELYVNTSDYFDGSEYIELYNRTGSAIDLEGWVLTSTEYDTLCGEHHHEFPAGTTIGAYDYLIIARDSQNDDSTGFSCGGRFGFLPDLEMYDSGQSSYERDDPRVDNTYCQNPDSYDDQIRLYPGTSDYGFYRGLGTGRYEVVYLYSEPSMTNLIDAVEYNDLECNDDRCPVNGANDAFPFYPSQNRSLGRDEDGTDTDNSAVDLYPQPPTPGAENVNPPEFWTLRYSPCVPTTSDQVTISCNIVDKDGVLWARCYYAVATDPPDFSYSAWDSVVMTDIDGDSVYTGTLPAQPFDPSYLKFYVRASDTKGMVGIYPEDAPDEPYNYSVGMTPIANFQYVESGDDSSYYMYQAVNTSGVVTAEPGVYNDYTFVIQDGSGWWSGVHVYDAPGTTSVARGDSVTVSGWVGEYYARTTVNLFSGCVTNHGPGTLPPPTVAPTVELSLTAGTNPEVYEGVYVAAESCFVTNDSLNEYGEWEINDGTGPCRVDDYAYYVYEPEQGDSLESVRGIFDYSYDFYKIQPRGDEDIIGPPTVSYVRYTPHAPTSSDVITVSATVKCANPIDYVRTYFTLNEGATWDSTDMSTSDSVYSGTLGPLPNDSSVEYYVGARSTSNNYGRQPTVGTYSLYVGRVSIYDIQNPAGGDSSSYAGKPINTSGIVTAGTGTFSDYWFFIMEDYGVGSAEYRGVKVYDRTESLSIARGDSVTVSGDVWEYFFETEIALPFPEAVTVHSSGHALPPAYEVTAGSVNTSEQWEGVLVVVDSAAITNPDNGYGEWTIYSGGAPDDTCIVGDIATYSYTPYMGIFVDVTGVVMFGYGEFTLQPRDDDDIICHPGAGIDDHEIPVRLAMSIFPNPVMSAGEIRLAIPADDRVSVKIYDVNGKHVGTLMDRDVQAGEHRITWDGSNRDGRHVTAGIYFVRVETTRGSLTKKMVLSR